MQNPPLLGGNKRFCKIIVAAISTINQKMLINAAQKMKLSIKDFFSKCEQTMQFPLDLVTFAEEILYGKLHFFMRYNFYHCPATFSCNDITVFFPTSKKSSRLSITFKKVFLKFQKQPPEVFCK